MKYFGNIHIKFYNIAFHPVFVIGPQKLNRTNMYTISRERP